MNAHAEGTQWTETLVLRDEVRRTDGAIGELQMSLAKAVYETVPVPYANLGYYTDITQPTPLLVGFLGRIARRLGAHGLETKACFHLDQGMGGGKSHALVGAWHMVNVPQEFFDTELGNAVLTEATTDGYALDLADVVQVLLIGDSMSPGRKDPRFGPATDLFGRFLWLLFADRQDRMARWQHYVALGANKATLQAAFAEVAAPVLIVLDELMDYAMQLTDETAIGGLPGEQAFLNALADAVDDQPQIALIIVMIRSDKDGAGYHPAAEEFRDYLSARLRRNGETVTVTESADFAQIIRRRLFARADIASAGRSLAAAYVSAAEGPWQTEVYARLGTGRSLAGLPERVVETYPFHPDLFDLVAGEWSVVQSFQRVRSTVAIFARTVLHWTREHEAGRWVPDLIGVGDIPLHTSALEAVLDSGVLAGNERAVQGFRAVATTDIVRSGGGAGTAFALDKTLAANRVSAHQPSPAQRMATACFAYSLVPRPQASRGATKAELLAAIAAPGVGYTDAEEIFNALVSGPLSGGLGSLERMRPPRGKGPERFYLSIKQTLSMYHANAMTMITLDAAMGRFWQRARELATRSSGFSTLQFIEHSIHGDSSLESCFARTDAPENRLVILDPRRWTLLNGKDAETRRDLDLAFGIVPGLAVSYAASMVAALVNTQHRTRARDRARDVMAWEIVESQLDRADEEHAEAEARHREARADMDTDVRKAFQHYAYLLRTADGLSVQFRTMPENTSSLDAKEVWRDLVQSGRAVDEGALAPQYVAQLIRSGSFGRDLTPRELFTLPYANPAWPMLASADDFRTALFHLASGDEWILTDSDGTEIQLGTPGQIQPASIQQVLRPREPAPASLEAPSIAPTLSPPTATTVAPPNRAHRPPADAPAPLIAEQQPEYEVTTLRMPLSSLTDASRRESVWGLIREIASLIDPAKRTVDLQMLGLEITITARTGDALPLTAKSRTIPGVTVSTEPDDL